MKVIFNNSSLVFKKSMPIIPVIPFSIVKGAAHNGIVQANTSAWACFAFDVRNCNKIIVDGVFIRTSDIGYFYNGDVPTSDVVSFPKETPEVLNTWKQSHSIVTDGVIYSETYGYVNGDIIENVEITVPEGATMFIAWCKDAGANADNVTVYKKE